MTGPPPAHPSLGPGWAPGGGPFRHLTAPPPLRVWVWTAAVLVLAVVGTLLWRGSDAAATHSSTAEPADVPPGTPAGAVSAAWSADGDRLPADVVEAGRVVVGSAHGIRALDPVSGEEAWRYTRDNARLCGVTVTDGVVVAVFRTADRCDEAVGLDAGTGVRSWTRNVAFAADATLSSTDGIVLAASRGGVVTLDPTGSSTRWRYAAPSGCRLLDAAVGDAGVVVLQRCTGGSAVQLRLLDGFGGEQRWTHDVVLDERAEGSLLGADSLVGVLADDEVRLFAAADGTLLTTLPAGPDRTVRQTSTAAAVLLHAEGTLTAFSPQTAQRLWEHPATGLPGEPAEAGSSAPLAAPERSAVVLRDPATGAELDRFAVDGLPDGGTATVVGPVIVLRADDRVLGYR